MTDRHDQPAPAATEATDLRERLTALRDRWQAAGPPPGTSRWWNIRLAELDTAIGQPAAGCRCSDGYQCSHRCWHCKANRTDGCESWCHVRPFDGQPAHDAGPTVREAADADRNWDVEKAGE